MSQAVLLSPHHDDAELFACFSLLRARPLVIVCTRAVVQEQRGYTFLRDGIEEPITPLQRELETAAAMQILGLEWEQWDFPDDLENRPGDVKAELSLKIAALARDYYHCYAPAFETWGHYDHNLIANCAIAYFATEPEGDRLTQYLTYTRSHGRSRGVHPVEFEPHWPALKMRALACYESQIQHPSTRDHFMGDLWEWTL
jgi:LmbE family N-acetylglucosaminyl deacetylase